MGMTLDTLLDTTGISEMGSPEFKKTAAQNSAPDFLKLAERCRKAAAAPSAAPPPVDSNLAEKTAEVAIISRTLSEIDDILGDATHEKTAVSVPNTAAFIKEALSQGHSPEDIAVFLKTSGIFSGIGRAVEEARAGHALGKGEKLIAKGEEIGMQGKRRAESLLRNVAALGHKGRDTQEAVLKRLRVAYGDDKAAKMLADSGAKLHHLDEARDLKPIIERSNAKPPLISANIGGKQVDVTGEQLGRVAKPAAIATGGALAYRGLTGGGGGDKKKHGVVIVNS